VLLESGEAFRGFCPVVAEAQRAGAATIALTVICHAKCEFFAVLMMAQQHLSRFGTILRRFTNVC
jgi:hypothetical protein